jgi:hypothetical protein
MMAPSKRFLCACAAALAIATVFSGDPMAYMADGVTWAQPQMSYRVNSANANLAAAAVEAAVRSGADAWQEQTGAFRFTYAGTSSQTGTSSDGTNLVLFRNAANGSAVASTYVWSTNMRVVDADIVFWGGDFNFFAGSSGCSGGFYIEDIAAHEFGHALGLGHSTAAAATMYPSTSTCNTQNRTLDPDDISGVRALYPAALSSPAPLLSPPRGLRIVG